MAEAALKKPATTAGEGTEKPEKARAERRDIPGNFSYTAAPGVLTKVLQRLIVSERPSQFTQDFLGTVLQSTGGSARMCIPILKKAGLLRPDSVPTERYAQFQSDSRRAQAALEALKDGWSELFRRNKYAHKLDSKQTEDLFVEITGLRKNDPTFKAILGTYNVFKEYAKDAPVGVQPAPDDHPSVKNDNRDPGESGSRTGDLQGFTLGLANQVNVILPETTDINVYNAIFRSLRENLLR